MKFEIYQKYCAKYFEEHIALRIIVRLGTDKDECCRTKGSQSKDFKGRFGKCACLQIQWIKISNTFSLLKFQSYASNGKITLTMLLKDLYIIILVHL